MPGKNFLDADRHGRRNSRTCMTGKRFSDVVQTKEAEEVIWLPPRDSNPDMLIQSQLSCR